MVDGFGFFLVTFRLPFLPSSAQSVDKKMTLMLGGDNDGDDDGGDGDDDSDDEK